MDTTTNPLLVKGLITLAAVSIPALYLLSKRLSRRTNTELENSFAFLLRSKQADKAKTLLASMSTLSGSLHLLNLATATGDALFVDMLLAKMPTWREHFTAMQSNDMETTPLHVAACHGFLPIAALFLDGGIDANIADLGQQTPLFLAASGGYADMARLLLARGADVFRQTNSLKTAVHYAAHLGQDEILRVFAAHLAGSTLEDVNGEEAPCAGSEDDEASCSKDNLARLMALKDISGYTALHVACLGGSVSTVKLLLSFDADVNKPATDGSTSLHLATQPQNKNASIELVRVLVDAGADPLVMTTFGSSPLHLACGAARSTIVRELLACTARRGCGKEVLAAQDNDGMLPIHSLCHAVTNKRFDNEAAVFGCIGAMLDAGADVNGMDYGDATVLHYLTAAPPTPLIATVAARFVAAGARVTAENGQGWTALHCLLNHLNFEENTISNNGRDNKPDIVALRSMEDLFRTAAATENPDFLASFDPNKPRDLSNRLYLQRRGPHNRIPLATRQALLHGDFTLKGIAEYINRTVAEKGTMNIIVMAGAGTSVSAGIPDFRSPTSGLYSDKRYQNAFSYDKLHEDPELFYNLLRDVFYPVTTGEYKPTPTHHFFRLLHDKGLLRRLYTQNVDTLDRRVGLPLDKIVEAHGTLAVASCAAHCGAPTDMDYFWACVGERKVARCKCGGLIVPDVVFFGQGMPAEFIRRKDDDLAKADLIIVLGTSLVVYPFAGMVNQVSLLTPRLLINKTRSGPFQYIGTGKDESDTSNYRDVAHLSPCDDGVQELCKHLGWLPELDALSAAPASPLSV